MQVKASKGKNPSYFLGEAEVCEEVKVWCCTAGGSRLGRAPPSRGSQRYAPGQLLRALTIQEGQVF